jgi:hypothetical protein
MLTGDNLEKFKAGLINAIRGAFVILGFIGSTQANVFSKSEEVEGHNVEIALNSGSNMMLRGKVTQAGSRFVEILDENNKLVRVNNEKILYVRNLED